MTLDPEVATLLPALDRGFPRVERMSGHEARAAIRSRLPADPNPIAVDRVIDRTIPGPDGELPVRIYWPADAPTTPAVIVFAHGGGFVFCDLDSHDDLCRSMANGVGAVVMSVGYRRAPEHPWPAAALDVRAATEWVAAHAEQIGVDVTRLVLAGDSAGGNLAAVTAIMLRDDHGPAVRAQALFYPVIAADFTTESYRRFAEGYYNTEAAMRWYWDQYVPLATDRTHPHASPGHAQLAGLPPTVLVTAGFDPLASEGHAYAQALADAGVTALHRDHPGAIHGFMTMPSLSICGRARAQAWADIRDLADGRPSDVPAARSTSTA
ncbi:alpha/beta hydrolase [Gordonia sp. CPCC 206044]|uniref:alpha/beta hydrolase n=1 Tax=Gordonia sp. CPCC 206044 TaxID=3140793 RepID=UPI003AF379D7